MTELELLATEYLPFPEGIEIFIYDHTDYRTRNTTKVPRFVETIEFYGDKLLRRTFGFVADSKNKSLEDMKIREVCRELEGFNHCLLRDVWSPTMGGHRVEFNEFYQDKEFYIHKGRKWSFFSWSMYDKEEWIKKLNIPYCQYLSEENKSILDFFDYICLYRKEPKIELLVKAGYSQYLTGLRYLDLKQKSLEKIFKVDKKWLPYLKEMDVSQLLLARKYKCANTIKDLQFIANIKRQKYICKYLNRRMLDWCSANYRKFGYLGLYDDCLRFSEQLGMDMKDNKVLFPTNINRTHDRLSKEIKVAQSKEQDEKIMQMAEKHKKYIFSGCGFIIFPASSTEELIEESKELNHCVRTYAERVARGETEIMFVRAEAEPKIPLYTLELKGKKVIQFRADHNKRPPEEAINFVNFWCKKHDLKCNL